MKFKSLFLILILTVMIFSGCSQESNIEVPDGMKLFSNEHTDYTAFVPANWIVDMSTGTLSAYVSSADASNIRITAQTLEAPTTLDDYWKGYEEDFKATFDDMEYVGEAPTTTTLSGLAANKYVYTATVTGTEYKFMQVVCIREMTVYVITYTSTPEGYDSNMEDVEKIL
ncbi:MAG: DcrB-related protein, partial [Clostridia bacterium]|nr:DcrB-related protein [Clostridia bacterium]